MVDGEDAGNKGNNSKTGGPSANAKEVRYKDSTFASSTAGTQEHKNSGNKKIEDNYEDSEDSDEEPSSEEEEEEEYTPNPRATLPKVAKKKQKLHTQPSHTRNTRARTRQREKEAVKSTGGVQADAITTATPVPDRVVKKSRQSGKKPSTPTKKVGVRDEGNDGATNEAAAEAEVIDIAQVRRKGRRKRAYDEGWSYIYVRVDIDDVHHPPHAIRNPDESKIQVHEDAFMDDRYGEGDNVIYVTLVDVDPDVMKKCIEILNKNFNEYPSSSMWTYLEREHNEIRASLKDKELTYVDGGHRGAALKKPHVSERPKCKFPVAKFYYRHAKDDKQKIKRVTYLDIQSLGSGENEISSTVVVMTSHNKIQNAVSFLRNLYDDEGKIDLFPKEKEMWDKFKGAADLMEKVEHLGDLCYERNINGTEKEDKMAKFCTIATGIFNTARGEAEREIKREESRASKGNQAETSEVEVEKRTDEPGDCSTAEQVSDKPNPSTSNDGDGAALNDEKSDEPDAHVSNNGKGNERNESEQLIAADDDETRKRKEKETEELRKKEKVAEELLEKKKEERAKRINDLHKKYECELREMLTESEKLDVIGATALWSTKPLVAQKWIFTWTMKAINTCIKKPKKKRKRVGQLVTPTWLQSEVFPMFFTKIWRILETIEWQQIR